MSPLAPRIKDGTYRNSKCEDLEQVKQGNASKKKVGRLDSLNYHNEQCDKAIEKIESECSIDSPACEEKILLALEGTSIDILRCRDKYVRTVWDIWVFERCKESGDENACVLSYINSPVARCRHKRWSTMRTGTSSGYVMIMEDWRECLKDLGVEFP